MSVLAGARNASLEDMVATLREQQAHKIDVVAPATKIRSRNGSIEVRGVEPFIGENGVTVVDGLYRPTADGDASIATKLGIGVPYMRFMRNKRPDLYDANVNGLLHGKSRRNANGEVEQVYPADERSFLLRLFASDDGGEGVMRGLLSDSYGIIDNLDVLMAVLGGIQQAGVHVEIRQCDVTDSSMYVKVYSPEVAQLAPTFLRDYRTPFANPELEAARQEVSRWMPVAEREGMARGEDAPVVFAGFRFSNNELGAGRVVLKPDLFVRICDNGLTLPMYGLAKTHLGAKMAQGAINWSLETQNKNLAVISSQAKDAVREWLSPDFLARRVEEVEQAAGSPVTRPAETIKVVGRRLGFTEDEQNGILAHFTSAGQLTAAGVANAITSYSQTVPDAARADALDDLALKAMSEAAKAA